MVSIVFIIPYRNRETQLKFFREHIKYIMEDYSKDDYKIIVVHQKNKETFNCGAIKNIGFTLVRHLYPKEYKDITLVFNDVDTMPKYKNMFNYKTHENKIKHFFGFNFALGGIVSITGKDFEKVNGFPSVWSYGIEDNTLQKRALKNNITIDRSEFVDIKSCKNVIHFKDDFIKVVNHKELYRVHYGIVDGVSDLKNIIWNYDSENDVYDIYKFDTKYPEDKKTTYIHDQNKLGAVTMQRSKRKWNLF